MVININRNIFLRLIEEHIISLDLLTHRRLQPKAHRGPAHRDSSKIA